MENNYEELKRSLEELEEGMTPEALSKLTTEQYCYVIEQIAQIKGRLAAMKNNNKESEEE